MDDRFTGTAGATEGRIAGSAFVRFLFAVLLVVLAGCPAATPLAEEDLGPIEAVVDEVARTVWPGVEGEDGRFVRLLNGFFAGEPTAFWFGGLAPRRTADLFWFCRDGDASCPFDDSGSFARDRAVGDPVFATMPGEVDHSPFWRLWVVRVPADYEADELKSTFGIQQAADAGRVFVEAAVADHGGDIGPAEVLVHCLMVLEGTVLEGNGDDLVGRPGEPSQRVVPRMGWHKQYRVNVFDFVDTEGVFAPNTSSESVPVMPEANILVFHRDCAGGSTSPACDALAMPEVAVSERGVEEDLTGDGDKRDTNNIITGFPGVAPGADPWETPYSPLWRVKGVRVPAATDADVDLIDTTGDQDVSDARSVADVRTLVEAGLIAEPEDLPEDGGISFPGNGGSLFFSCHTQVAAR